MITAAGDRYLYVGTKLILWDSGTKLKINGGQIAAGMAVQWKGKRDATTGAVLANQLAVN